MNQTDSKTETSFRSMTADDWDAVAEIYRQGIATGNATFQQDIPTWNEWNNAHLEECRIVAEKGDDLVGWVALSPVSGRCVYAGVAEVSVYVSDKFKGEKVGTKLLEQLIAESEKEGIWTLQAGIFRENTPSIHLHERSGFRLIGYREKVGKMNGQWRDTLLFERRSKVVGVD